MAHSRSLSQVTNANLFRAQQEYDQLMEKKEQIEGDKEKIVHFITELDEKKNKELLETYKKVDKDFGSIFSTLLRMFLSD
jgi:structural maintenance of chromosome 2